MAADNINIQFKQLRGGRPQSPLVLQDADLTPVAQKQLDKAISEGGMLETGTFKQSPGMNMSSAFYEIKLSINGKTHEAEIDEVNAPPAYSKLIKLILKYGHKPAETADRSEDDNKVAQKPEGATKASDTKAEEKSSPKTESKSEEKPATK
jgi:hypothetical protein